MTPVSIRRKTPNVICHHLTALIPRCTKTSYLLTPYYTYPHRNSDNLRNAIYIVYSLVGQTPYCGLTSSLMTQFRNIRRGHHADIIATNVDEWIVGKELKKGVLLFSGGIS